jgi:DNA-binding transcriptional LysR family regulator
MEERLIKFAALVNAGNFTSAAQQLRTSQPALSIAIAKLEQELNVKLIVRGVRPFTLTKAGQIVYEAAEELIITADNLKTKLAELSHQQLSLTIGMIDSIASTLFLSSDNFSDFEREANISVVVNNSRYLLRAVEHDELNIAFITEQFKPVNKQLRLQYVAVEPLVLVAHSAQAAATQNDWQHGHLDNFISYDQPSNSYQLIKRFLDQNKVIAPPVFFSTSVDVILRLVQLQKGVAALPYVLVKDFIASKELALIGTPKPIIIDRSIFAAVRRDRQNSLLLTKIVHRLEQLLSFYYQELDLVKFAR